MALSFKQYVDTPTPQWDQLHQADTFAEQRFPRDVTFLCGDTANVLVTHSRPGGRNVPRMRERSRRKKKTWNELGCERNSTCNGAVPLGWFEACTHLPLCARGLTLADISFSQELESHKHCHAWLHFNMKFLLFDKQIEMARIQSGNQNDEKHTNITRPSPSLGG